MDSDIQPVVDQLLAAILAQRYKASRAILEDLVAKAEGMDLTGYTAESVAAFRTALDQAKAVLAQESNQAAVEAAVTALNDAMANLTQRLWTRRLWPSSTPMPASRTPATSSPPWPCSIRRP